MQIDNKGIWLYYNSKGNSIAKISHGEVIRQGGGFTLLLAFEKDQEWFKDKYAIISFKKPGESAFSIPDYIGGFNTPNIATFKKIKNNEMTYGLIDGKEYIVLKYRALESYGYTEKYGTLTALVEIKTKVGDYQDYDGEKNASGFDLVEGNDTTFFQGAVQLYVEPTYGKQTTTTNISMSQAAKILEEIHKLNERIDNADNGLNSKLDKENAIGDKAAFNLEAKELKMLSGNISSGVTLEKGVISNGLIINNEVFEGNYAVNKNYVDSQVNYLKKTLSYRGTFDSKELLDAEIMTPAPKTGDYALVRKEGMADSFYVWDENLIIDEEGIKGGWVEKGTTIKSAVYSVAGKGGDVVLDDKDILVTARNNETLDKTLEFIFRSLIQMPKFENEWVSGKNYEINNIVKSGKNLYICIKDVENSVIEPSQDTEHWETFVQGFSGDYNELDNAPGIVDLRGGN